jgi:UDP-N-acetylmuramyl pentapeptide phosphotransferase/UDP-N-acetylglucosamine-1-phosphate transferase
MTIANILKDYRLLIISIIIVFLLSFSLTIIFRKWAIRRNIFDIPNERSAHLEPTPRGGGIAIVITWLFAVLILYITQDISYSLFTALMCGIPIAIIGMIDDIWSISPYIRLSVQVLCAALAIYFLGGILYVDIGFTILKSSIILNAVALIGTVWFINLFNFLDGIDGYISSEIIFVCLAAFILSGSVLPLLLASAAAGFLLCNWQPAKIFMGDVGSTLLGFTIAIFSVYYQNTSQSSVILWSMLTSVFWFDATMTLFRRIINREKISIAHKKHAYQRIVQSGFSHQKTVLSAMVINLIIFILIFVSTFSPKLVLIYFFFNLLLLYIILKIVDSKFPFNKESDI